MTNFLLNDGLLHFGLEYSLWAERIGHSSLRSGLCLSWRSKFDVVSSLSLERVPQVEWNARYKVCKDDGPVVNNPVFSPSSCQMNANREHKSKNKNSLHQPQKTWKLLILGMWSLRFELCRYRLVVWSWKVVCLRPFICHILGILKFHRNQKTLLQLHDFVHCRRSSTASTTQTLLQWYRSIMEVC